MTIAYGCVFMMIVFPYIFTILAKTVPGFNYGDPRASVEKVTGWRKRAYYVQLNTFEAMPAFAVAVIIAHLLSVAQPMIDRLAVAFVVTRVLYAMAYLGDKPLIRFLCWASGFGCVIGLFCLAF